MSKKERIMRRRRKKKIKLFLAIIITLYILFMFLPNLYSSKSQTILIKNESIEKKINNKAVLIKDEKLYKAKGDGDLQFHHDEGEKIAKDEVLITQINATDTNEYEYEIKSIEMEIDKLNNENKSNTLFSKDLDKLKEEINAAKEKLKIAEKEKDKDKIKELEKKIAEKKDKVNTISRQNGFMGYSINELLEKKEALLKKISENNNSILSEESGIISYQFDDYEKKYSINNMSSLKPKDIEINTPQIKNIKKLSDIDLGDSIIKTIKDFKWFIAINIPIKDSKELNKEDNINIRIKKDNRKLKGKIIEINSDKNNAMILIELDSYLYKYYKDRVLDVDIILKEYDGLKIPSKAVVEKDGSKGVYTKNVDSIIKFKPINIIYEKDDFVIASKDEENRISVQAFDEVIIDGKMIESYIKE